MTKEFSESGVSFRYPENWALEREASGAAWTVTLQSKETAFLVVTLDPTMPTPDEMAKTALWKRCARSTRNWRPIRPWICWPAKWRSATTLSFSASI